MEKKNLSKTKKCLLMLSKTIISVLFIVISGCSHEHLAVSSGEKSGSEDDCLDISVLGELIPTVSSLLIKLELSENRGYLGDRNETSLGIIGPYVQYGKLSRCSFNKCKKMELKLHKDGFVNMYRLLREYSMKCSLEKKVKHKCSYTCTGNGFEKLELMIQSKEDMMLISEIILNE